MHNKISKISMPGVIFTDNSYRIYLKVNTSFSQCKDSLKISQVKRPIIWYPKILLTLNQNIFQWNIKKPKFQEMHLNQACSIKIGCTSFRNF